MTKNVQANFEKAFGNGDGETRIFFAPGRVNLIGEHVDYSGGLVLPCAIGIGTYGVIRRRKDDMILLASGNNPLKPVLDLNTLGNDPIHGWGNYPKAVARLIMKKGYALGGFELYVEGNMPSGAGLSSSASLTSLVAFTLNEVFGLGIDPITRVRICQDAEAMNGVNCGVMDPFACTLGKKDHGILLDCSSLKYEYIPLNLGDYRIMLANTNKRRSLADSKYNERRAECEAAVLMLRKAVDIGNLCELAPHVFEQHKHIIKDETVIRRATHAVYENQRTKDTAAALHNNELQKLPQLLMASHESLRDNYEVVGAELEAMVQATVAFSEGLLGTRMTGAGFGGCTVSLLHKDYIEDFTAKVGAAYNAKTGLQPDFYVVSPWDGVKECQF
ncbi:MAG: galactokinase [Defluviitaleaceae bacterium]|nr:galactokinase [Defluviitaleaceae bacterium]